MVSESSRCHSSVWQAHRVGKAARAETITCPTWTGIQRDSPGKGLESNWLPTPPEGGFSMNLRLYWPKA